MSDRTETRLDKSDFSSESRLVAAPPGGATPEYDAVIDGTDGDDVLDGTPGDDLITGGDGNDTINGFSGFDEIYGGNGDDVINGGAFSDLIEPGEGNDRVFGGDNNDEILSTGGSDYLNGGSGGDNFTINHGTQVAATIEIEAGIGDDFVSIDGLFTSAAGSHSLDFDLGEGADTVFIAALPDNGFQIDLGAGADRVWLTTSLSSELEDGPVVITDFEVGEGGDFLQVEELADTYFVNSNGEARWFDNGDDMVLQLRSGASGSEFVDVVVLQNTEFGRLEPANTDLNVPIPGENFDGTTGDDFFVGGEGDDTFDDGFGGSDTFIGNGGNDRFTIERGSFSSNNIITVDGGAGVDSLSIEASVEGLLTADMGEGDDFVTFQIGAPAGNPSIETAITLGAGSDTVVYRSRTATATILDFEVGDGGDIFEINIFGLAATQSDIINKGDPFGSGELILTQVGADTVLEKVTLPTGASLTVAVFRDTNADDFTSFNFGGVINPDAGRPAVTFNGTGASDSYTGTLGQDTINGLGGADTLDGGDGADVIDGGDENDTITGGFGNDTIRGGSGNDTINEAFGTNMIFGGTGDDTINLTGFSGIPFSQAPDQIFGEDGNDTVNYFSTQAQGLIVDLGDGVDRIVFNNQPLFNELTLGAGSDVVDINPLGRSSYRPSRALVITDFEAGDGGDKLDWEIWVRAQTGNETTPNWNPFAFNETQLTQVGDDVHLEWSVRTLNGGSTLVIFQNTQVGDFTTANFGFDPQAPIADGDDFVGTPGDDTFVGTNVNDTGVGLGGNDTLSGLAGDDDLDGGPGNDRINGDQGDDMLAGGADDDIIFGGTGADTIFGNSGNDEIDAGVGDGSIDYIDAGNGDDVIRFSGSNDTYIGGSGNDTLFISGGSSGLREAIDIDLSNFIATGTFLLGGQLITDIESLAYSGDTSEFDDRVVWGAAYTNAQTIRSGGGDDDITATSGDDTLDGEEGDDIINGLGGRDFITDTLGNNTIDGGDDRDIITTGSGNDTILGGTGDDLIDAGDGNNVIDGGLDDDAITAGVGIHQISGGEGDDSIRVSGFEAGTLIDGGDGTDLLIVSSVFGSSGIDVDFSSQANPISNVETVRFELADGADDRIILGEGFSSAVTVSAGDGDDVITGGSGDDIIFGGEGENVILGGSGDDGLRGNGFLDGGEGNDSVSGSGMLFGGAGNDRITGSGMLRGGSGEDSFSTSGDGATILLEAGLTQETFDGRSGQMDVIQATADGSRLLWVTGIEQNPNLGREELVEFIEVISDGGFADFGITGSDIDDEIFLSADFGSIDVILEGAVPIYGLGGNDRIRGSLGDDTIFGGEGNDILSSSQGADTLHGGLGDDIYSINHAGQTLVENADEGEDRVTSSVDIEIGDHIEILELTGNARVGIGGNTDNTIRGQSFAESELFGRGGNDNIQGGTRNDFLDGGLGDDELFGFAGNDHLVDFNGFNTLDGGTDDDLIEGDGILIGGFGNDILRGGGNNDFLEGGEGDDFLDGAGGSDTADYSRSFDAVTIDLRITSQQNTGGAGLDTLINVENLIGTSSSDILIGNDGSNTLRGGGSDDTLIGGSNIDFAVFSGNLDEYIIVELEDGRFLVGNEQRTDSLEGIEFAVFDDQTFRLLPGTGVSVNFNTTNPQVYQAAMNNIRDFDGNVLGGNGSWLRIGEADVNGDGDIDQILVNDAIARFATVGTADDGLVYFEDFSWAGETRVAGIYIDPLVQAGIVDRFSPNDSQQRFQNDLAIENINRVLGADDYDGDGLQDVYFALTDGTAYLRAIMESDGNIRYANYQSQEQVIEFLEANGFGEETYGDWFPPGAEPTSQASSEGEAASAMLAEATPMMAISPAEMFQTEVFG